MESNNLDQISIDIPNYKGPLETLLDLAKNQKVDLAEISVTILADQFLNWADIWADIKKRSYITVGLISFIILIILAITSPKKAVKKIGAKRWRKLHQSIYIASIAAVVHYWMMVKGDYTNPLFYSVFLFLLLSYRIVRYFKNNFLEKIGSAFHTTLKRN